MSKPKKILSSRNEKRLNEFIIHTKMRIHNPRTLKSYDTYNRIMLHNIGKDFDKINIKDLEKFYTSINPRTAEVYKTKNKKFLIYCNREKLAKQILTNGSILAKPIRNDEDILTPEEINKLIQAPIDLMDKALIELMIITGLRNKETRYLNWEDIKEETDCIKINQRLNEGKIKRRTITLVVIAKNPVAFYPKYLMQFWRNHIYKNTVGKPLFFSKKRDRKGKRLGEVTINSKVGIARRNAKIEKKITPHILRHTSATYNGEFFHENVMCNIYGWEESSRMSKRYVHYQDKQTEQYVKRIAGITEEQTINGLKCPRCNEINNINSTSCIKCHTVLNLEDLIKEQDKTRIEIEEKDKKIKEIDKELSKIKKILDTNRIEFTDYKNKSIETFEEFTKIIDKYFFKEKHKKELLRIEKQYKNENLKLLKNGKITEEEYLKGFKNTLDEYYNKFPRISNIKSIDDLRKFRTEKVIPLAKEILKEQSKF